MEQENKNKLAQSLETIKILMTKWERVKNIAEDIIAFSQQDATRFRLEIGNAVRSHIIYGYVSGTERYITYESQLNEMSLRQI